MSWRDKLRKYLDNPITIELPKRGDIVKVWAVDLDTYTRKQICFKFTGKKFKRNKNESKPRTNR